ncbi:hypothetical protein RI367_001828 [Sorochytrium milnesiophthora]
MASQQPPFSYTTVLLCVATAALMTMSISRHLRPRPAPKLRKQRSILANAKNISLEALTQLTKSHNVALQGSALNILLERALNDNHLRYIIRSCSQPDDEELRYKAVSVLQLLTKKDDYKETLLKAGAISALVNAAQDARDLVRKAAIISLYDLTSSDDSQKQAAVALGVLEPLRATLQDKHTPKDLIYWTLILVHQFALSAENSSADMVNMGFVPLLGMMLRETYGNANMQKLCLHAIVRLVGQLEASAAQQQLEQLLQVNIVAILASSFRHEDSEIVYWSLGLTHEYAVKDVARDKFRAVPNSAKTLCGLLITQDSNLAKIVIRILKFLGLRHPEFQKQLLMEDVLPRLIPCLTLEDDDCQYWALTLLHDLAAHPEAHPAIMELNGANVLLDLVSSTRPLIPLYVVDILSYICSLNKSEDLLQSSNLVEALIRFVRSENPELRSGGLASLFNLAVKSSDLVEKMVESDCLDLLRDNMLTSDKHRIQALCAKILLILSVKDPNARAWYLGTVLIPLTHNIINLSNDVVNMIFLRSNQQVKDGSNAAEPVNDLGLSGGSQLGSPLFADGQPRITTTNVGPRRVPSPSPISAASSDQPSPSPSAPLNSAAPDTADAMLETPDLAGSTYNLLLSSLVDRLTGLLESLSMFSLVPEHWAYALAAEEQQFVRTCDALVDLVVLPLLNSDFKLRSLKRHAGIGLEQPPNVYLPGHSLPNTPADPTSLAEVDEITHIRQMLSKVASTVLALLSSHDVCRDYLMQERFLNSMVSIAEEYESMTEHVITLLATVAEHGATRDSIVFVPHAITLVWAACIQNTAVTKFYATNLLDSVVVADDSLNSQYVKFSSVDKTSNLALSRNGLSFDVVLHTQGLAQIGWATLQCQFDTLCGKGVGDDFESYSYDGHRCKKWHGNATEDNTYGELWQMGDVISCMIDLDHCTISYQYNGAAMGTAFTDIDVSMTWFPALSLAPSQSCSVLFGSKHDPLRYPHRDYQSIASAVMNLSSNVVSPISEHSLSGKLKSPRGSMDSTGGGDRRESISLQSPIRETRLALYDELESCDDQRVSPVRAGASDLFSPITEATDAELALPSLYFEVMMGVFGIELGSRAAIVGYVDRANRLTALAFADEGCYLFSVDHDVNNHDYFAEPLLQELRALREDGGHSRSTTSNAHSLYTTPYASMTNLALSPDGPGAGSDASLAASSDHEHEHDPDDNGGNDSGHAEQERWSEAGSTATITLARMDPGSEAAGGAGLQLIQYMPHGQIKEADVIGAGLLLDDRAIQFTRNGQLYGPSVTVDDVATRLRIPHVRNVGMFHINYGQEPFVRQTCNSAAARLAMSEYLCRP